MLTLFVNGKAYNLKEHQIDPKQTLLQFLRQNELKGTKLGCGEGGCGACTVMVSSYNHELKTIDNHAVNACLTPLCSLDGSAVTTVEGIGGLRQGMHPIQERLSSMHGSQCGFCTPGIVMSLYAQLRSKPNSTPHEIEEALDGNLCRCTGYRPIIDAARSLSNNKPSGSGCCGGKSAKDGSCPCYSSELKGDMGDEERKVSVHSSSEKIIAEKTSLAEELAARKNYTEPIFPPFLTHYCPASLKFYHDGVTWYQPVTLQELLQLKQTHPQARLVVGNTEVGIEVKFKAMAYPVLVNPSKVPDLKVLTQHTQTDGTAGILVGSAVTINNLRNFIAKINSEFKTKSNSYATRGLVAIHDMLGWFASNQIRNVACIGGACGA